MFHITKNIWVGGGCSRGFFSVLSVSKLIDAILNITHRCIHINEKHQCTHINDKHQCAHINDKH
jgi:hypothetical protein